MKALMAIAIAVAITALPLAYAQDLGTQSGSNEQASGAQLAEAKPVIERLHVVGKGVFMPAELTNTKLIKAVVGAVKTPSGLELTRGVLRVDGLADHSRYTITDIETSEGTVTGVILNRESGEVAGNISIERVSFGVEKVKDAWIGTMTLGDLNGKVFIQSAKRDLKPSEKVRIIKEERARGARGTDFHVITSYAAKHTDDQRLRNYLRVECEKEDNEVECEKVFDEEPENVRIHAVEILPAGVSARIVRIDDIKELDESSHRRVSKETFERRIIEMPLNRITARKAGGATPIEDESLEDDQS